VTDLDTIRAGWDQAAVEDAMFNIVTLPGKQGAWTEDEFFAHGAREVALMIGPLDELELRGPSRKWALDFGCGVGRLTLALASEYDHVYGADISVEMIRRAREMNRIRPTRHRVHYDVTGESLLDTYNPGKFDLIYSRITLQHMPRHLQFDYLQDFIELLAPNGIAVFQIPDGPEYRHPNEWLSMYGVPRADVEKVIPMLGGALLDVELLDDASPTWLAYRYTMARA